LKFSKKYCQFYKEKGHDTRDCYALKKEMERLLTQGYLKQFLKKDPPQEGEGGEVRQQRPTLIEVIFIAMEGYRVHRILVDDSSLVNILSVEDMTKMGIDTSRMTLVSTPLIGIEGSVEPVRGQ
jgi:hypothetical protein